MRGVGVTEAGGVAVRGVNMNVTPSSETLVSRGRDMDDWWTSSKSDTKTWNGRVERSGQRAASYVLSGESFSRHVCRLKSWRHKFVAVPTSVIALFASRRL